MRMNLEDDLTRTFRAAGLAAPDSEPGFSAALAARRCRRARTRMAAMTAAVTAMVAFTAGVAAFGLPGTQRPDLTQRLDAAPLPTGSLPTVDLSVAKPYRDLWPDALVELPLRLPDGRRYSVEAALGGDAYLVVPRDDRALPLGPVVLNARTGAARELRPAPASGYTEQARVYLTEHHIAWVVTDRLTGGATYHEVWSAPRDGGAAVRRARFGPDDTLVSVAEVGGVFYASAESSAGGGSLTAAHRRRWPAVRGTPCGSGRGPRAARWGRGTRSRGIGRESRWKFHSSGTWPPVSDSHRAPWRGSL
jgi:hypothetical protein